MKATKNDLLGLVDYIKEASDQAILAEDAAWWIRCADWIQKEMGKEVWK